MADAAGSGDGATSDNSLSSETPASPAGSDTGKSREAAVSIDDNDEEEEEEEHRRLVLGFIIGGHKPLSVVDEPEFKSMIRGFANRPNLSIPTRASVTELLTDKAIVARVKLKGMVKGQQLSLTCDGWTSGNEIPMMAVTGHWIDDNWEMKSACLSVFEIGGSHTGVRYVQTLVKVNRIIAYVHRSNAAKTKLHEAQKVHQLPENQLPTNVVTRWWSMTTSVVACLKNKPAIRLRCEWATTHQAKENIVHLTDDEWMVLRDVEAICIEWAQLQKRLEAEKKVTISTLDLIVDNAFSTVAAASTNMELCEEARECAEAMEADMYKRFHPEDEVSNFGDELHNGNPLKIPRTACVLDPRTKTCLWADDDDMEELFFGEVEAQLEVLIKAEEAKQEDQQRQLLAEREAAVEVVPTEKKKSDPPHASSITNLMQQAAARKKALRESSAVMIGPSPSPVRKKTKAAVSKRDQILIEWGLYKDEDVSDADVAEAGGTLAWWAKAQRLYPHIARLARKYLAVQASSAASERIFSVGGLVVTKHRNRLSRERVADIVFLHKSMKHDIWWNVCCCVHDHVLYVAYVGCEVPYRLQGIGGSKLRYHATI